MSASEPVRWPTVVILGGAGFIGLHWAEYLAVHGLAGRIILVDIEAVDPDRTTPTFRQLWDQRRFEYLRHDVRTELTLPPGKIDLIANFAAVHREPGHEPAEYWETNLAGATTACALAERHACDTILFTSSIAPYGGRDEAVDERSVPIPDTAYGSSKLVAEQMHRTWQAASAQRRLVIVRPGVVFGPGEQGNVSRLIRAVLQRRFVFVGNHATRKAGLYVAELCRATHWLLSPDRLPEHPVQLANLSMDPPPSMEEYVRAIRTLAGMPGTCPSVPFAPVMLLARVVSFAAGVFGRTTAVHPVRVRKLVRSNMVLPRYLSEQGYQFTYDLAAAMADWRQVRPADWAP